MFSGIVQKLGTVLTIETGNDNLRLRIAAGTLVTDLTIGDSVAVDGVCLTVAKVNPRGATRDFTVDVTGATLQCTTVGALSVGDQVNLEPAMRLGDRVGGHLVQGHVQHVGRVLRRHEHEQWLELSIELPQPLPQYVVPKGSIAVDGVSLTVVDSAEDFFTVAVIPTTARATNLGGRREGDLVNLEADAFAVNVWSAVHQLMPALLFAAQEKR